MWKEQGASLRVVQQRSKCTSTGIVVQSTSLFFLLPPAKPLLAGLGQSAATMDVFGKNCTEDVNRFRASAWKSRKNKNKSSSLELSIRIKIVRPASAGTHLPIVNSSLFVYFCASEQKIESSDSLLDCRGLLSGCSFSQRLVKNTAHLQLKTAFPIFILILFADFSCRGTKIFLFYLKRSTTEWFGWCKKNYRYR